MHKPLILGGVEFKSRLFLGTGKFSSAAALKAAIEASGTELVTVAMRRVDLNKQERDDILGAIDRSKVKIMLNTSGARTAEDAVKIARFGKDFFQWIKLEIHPDPIHLLPDPIETLKAAEILVKVPGAAAEHPGPPAQVLQDHGEGREKAEASPRRRHYLMKP